MWNRRTVSQQCWPYVITITKNHWEFSNSMGQISSRTYKSHLGENAPTSSINPSTVTH
uniref:Uncharacterized protein n=1 Tax=Anguilla anguilla TaxID=7936 RepID=A0A0E9VKT7_ANGAN